MKDLRDWTNELSELPSIGDDAVNELYAEMLATAHDIGYKVPDNLLVETEKADELRPIIPSLHQEIVAFHAAAKEKAAAKPTKEKAPAKTKAKPKKSAEKVPETSAEPETAPITKTKKAPKKAAAPASQKEQSTVEESSTMANTAKKTTKTAGAGKGGKGAAPAAKSAKGVAKKAAKKGAADNARTPVARSKHSPEAKITVKLTENPTREGSGRYDRVQNLIKHNGKTVAQFLKSDLGKSGTLNYALEQGWITIE
jgi:hypothetical protein